MMNLTGGSLIHNHFSAITALNRKDQKGKKMDRCWCGNTILDDYSANYRKCDRCRSLVTKADVTYNPDQINDDMDFYGKQYWETKMKNAAKAQDMDQIIDLYLHERAVYWLKNLFLYVLPGYGYIAETGCGLGQFSYLLKECGYEQTAYELSPEICRLIKSTFDINIVCGTFKQSDIKYDAVCAFDVMEHLQNPHEFLDLVVSSLKSKGILMIQMPCYDDGISFEEMRQKKPRFLEQMKENEHIYLYSKKSVKQILKEHGLEHVEFLEPYFGDDYDMFIVASQEPIARFQVKEIDDSLNKTKHGRLVKALIECWDNSRDNMEKLQESEADRTARMEQIENLTGQLQESEADRTARMIQISNLTGQLQESEADRAARMTQIENLTGQLQESEADRAARMTQIENLTGQLQESEADRAARMEQIENLTGLLQESEKDRGDRWIQIQKLTEHIGTLEDRVCELEIQYAHSEEQRKIAEGRANQLSEESLFQKFVRERKEKLK